MLCREVGEEEGLGGIVDWRWGRSKGEIAEFCSARLGRFVNVVMPLTIYSH